ncbi:MAG TPA: chemotaxis protein CheW [Frankiaceae bacterium]|nr:chemotaxis protein CheW [Frankiaceae bacterium]
MNEYVTFQLGGRHFATRIELVREVVRLSELVTLPGMRPPLAGVLDLRGVSLPVVDVRPERGPGDVLVLHGDEGAYGFVCDSVSAVVGAETLAREEMRSRSSMPDYVEEVLRGDAGPVFLVDVRVMAGRVELPLPA